MYCIFRADSDNLPKIPGIDGKPLKYIAAGDFFAATSELPGRVEPDIERLTAYEEVIDKIFLEFTVIPMRFGNYFEDHSRLEKLLENNGSGLAKVLEDLEGSSEMGIRVLATAVEPQEGVSDVSAPGAQPPPPSGTEYLARRKAHYKVASAASERQKQVESLLRDSFEGLFTRIKSEQPATGLSAFSPETTNQPGAWGLLLSAYFLVPKNMIDDFRRKFSLLSLSGAKFLLTGPWPPYSFADFKPAENSPDKDDREK